MDFDIISWNISRLVRSDYGLAPELYLRRYLRRPKGRIRVGMPSINFWTHNLYFGYYIRPACGGRRPLCRRAFKSRSICFPPNTGRVAVLALCKQWLGLSVRPTVNRALFEGLRADVITSASELEEFNRTVIRKGDPRNRGNPE
ncbi:MAG: hypothetical protein CM1200mP22_32540 [Dehalococcoidia bacterium]|nr:MAG: hypothetical protein CM1200mP22_32540 [Dehalococcoidia bacterium]